MEQVGNPSIRPGRLLMVVFSILCLVTVLVAGAVTMIETGDAVAASLAKWLLPSGAFWPSLVLAIGLLSLSVAGFLMSGLTRNDELVSPWFATSIVGSIAYCVVMSGIGHSGTESMSAPVVGVYGLLRVASLPVMLYLMFALVGTVLFTIDAGLKWSGLLKSSGA